jgi:hypothetical protein
MRPLAHRRFARLRQILLGGVLLAALQVTFAAFELTEVVTPGLGTLLSGASLRQFILNTDETVSGPAAADYLFGAVSGQLSLVKTQGPADVNIVAENIMPLGNVTVNAVPCRFHNDAQTTCDFPGINVRINQTRILHVGVDITTSLPHSGGDTASVTYDISVIFP